MAAVTRSLAARLALLLASVFVLLGVFVVLVMASLTEDYRQEADQKLNRDLARHIVDERLLVRDGEVDRAGLGHIFHMLMVINPAVEVYLLDPTGRILAFSAPPGQVRRAAVDLAPVRDFVDGTARLPIHGDDPRSASARKVFSAAPVEAGGRLQGYLYVILGGQSYDSVAQRLRDSYVLRLDAAVVAAGLVLALALATALSALLTRPLGRLAAAMDAFRSSGRVPPLGPWGRHGDEVERLRRSFEAMAARIAEQMARLEDNDRLRRAMVANVSHDLRTPLASVQGQLETLLLKEAELAPADRRRYLETALRGVTRLGTLVAELFELARLEADQVTPACEPFALPELVQDVMQKFELRAARAGVGLVQHGGDAVLPLVVADIGLIERVLNNLLDNALRHTPPGGRVAVTLTPGHGRVTATVRDTGCGIPAHDLPHVFERFYRGGGDDGPGGTGLGLAIVAHILRLHGSTIRATSTVGAGTAFTFDLPAEPVPAGDTGPRACLLASAPHRTARGPTHERCRPATAPDHPP